MSEIGDLKVRLSLDNAQFDRSVKSMNTTLKAMGQEIRGLQNKGKEWGSTVDGLKQKQDAYSRLLEGQQTKVKKLGEEYKKAKAEQGEHADKTQKLAEQYNRATAEMTRTETELKAISAELKKAEAELARSQSSWTKLGDAAKQAGEKMKAVGDKVKSVGQDLSMKLTAPLVGVGALAAKVGSDFEAGMSKVAAISGATGGDLAALEAKAREMGATTQFSASEAADALGYMAMAGWKTNDMLAGIGGVMNLAAASGEDLAMVSDIVTDALTAFGMSANDTGKFVDILAAASSNSNTNVAMLGESFKYAAPVVGALGMSADDAALALGLMANAGIKGSNSGTALRTMLTNLASPTKDMDKAMGALGISLTDSDGKMKTLRQVMDDLRGAFAKLEPAQQASYAATIFGKEAMSGALAIINASDADYQKLASSIDNSAGAAERMANIMNDNLKGRIKEMQSALAEAAISIFKALQPALESLVATIKKLADWFNTLSPEMMRTIVVIGGVVAAIGPLLVIVGTLISSIGTIVSSIGGLSVAIGAVGGATTAFGAAMALVTGPVGLAVAGIAALTAGGVALYKNWDSIIEKNPQLLATFAAISPPVVAAVGAIKTLQEAMSPAIEQVNLFGEGVSEATKKALGGYLELSDGVSQTLSEVYLTSTRITNELVSEMTAKYAEMNTKIVEGLKARHQEELTELENYFMNSSALTSAEEEKILARKQARNEQEIEQQNYMNQRIKEILQTAAEEKRALTEHEAEVINNYNRMMKENAVKAFSESELEQKVILERMKENASIATAEQAAKVVKNAVEQKQKVIDEAKKTYDEKYKLIIKMRDETGDISAEEAEKMIAEAKKSRDETIKLAEDRHKQIVSTAQKQADEHVGKVNWETGEVLSKWEVFKNSATKKWGEIKTNASKKWDEIKSDTIKKWEEIKAWPGKKIDEMKSAVEKKMGEVKTKIETKWKEAESFLAKVNLLDIGKDIVQGLINGMHDKLEAVGTKAKELGNKIITSVSSVLQRKSPSRVMIAIGKDVGEGLAIGIEGKNERVSNAMKDLGSNLINITNQYQSENKKITNKANAEIAQIEKRSKEDIDKIYRNAYAKKRKTNQDENIKIQRIQEDAAKKILAIEQKSAKDSAELLSKTQKDKLDKIKSFIEDKKSTEELTLIDEAYIWEQSLNKFAMYSKERVEAQKAYKAAVDAVNKEITSINAEYSNQIIKINDDLIKSEEALNKAYEDSVSKRENALKNTKGLFDEFKVELNRTGEELIYNLQSQIVHFEGWQREIESLSSRAIDDGLLEELRQMGPNALSELVALNSMTDAQLTQYSEMYRAKAKWAREVAEKEHIGMKNDTEKQIKGLRDNANKQLDQLQKEWSAKIKSLTKTTSTELSSLQQIGKDAGQGLLNGLASMESPLQAKAKEIANTIKNTIQSALDIHSPSRVMRGFGINVGEGLVLGMDDKIKQVIDAGKRLASAVVQPMDDFGIRKQHGFMSSSIDNSRSYKNGDTHIYVYGNNASPSEIARKHTQSQRQLAMEWGV